MGPEAGHVEASNFAKGIVTTAMSVAGKVVEQLQFAENGKGGGGAEGLLEFGQGGILWRRRCLRSVWGSKETVRIML